MDSQTPPRLTVVGLGPGRWESLTVEAADLLRSAKEVYVRTAGHPVVMSIAAHLPGTTFQSFASLYEGAVDLHEVNEQIVKRLSDLAQRDRGALYAVPGSPSVGDPAVQMLRYQLGDGAVHIVQGLSGVETVLSAVGVPDVAWLQVIDASEVALLGRETAVGEVEGLARQLPWRAPTPTASLLVSSFPDAEAVTAAQRWLCRYYPEHHMVHLVRERGIAAVDVQNCALFELESHVDPADGAMLYVPPLPETENVRTFAGLMQLTRTLRAPGGCPWDREQTHQSLKPHLLEETYEVLEALDGGDATELCEEMGDLLFQITIHSQIAAETGEFTIEDVIQNITCKLMGRHPHVFGEMELNSAQDVREVWETLKQREKPKRASILEQIPKGLPALPQSNLMQKRAASVGFEWPGVSEVIAKVEEELEELRHEINADASKDLQLEELGDILFALVSVARHLKLDPEESLRLANRKFAARFSYVESRVAGTGKTLRALSPEELDKYWNEAKALEIGPTAP